MWRWSLVCVGLLSCLSRPDSLQAAEKEDIYLSVHILVSAPIDRNVVFEGQEAPGTSVGGGVGAGLKAGIFPEFTKRMLGIELEYFGHGGSFTFPVTGGNRAGSSGTSNLIVFGSMVNVMLRYPGTAFQPYVGIGGGLSEGVLTGSDIPGRADRDFEASPTFGHQFLAGLQATLTKRTYIFGEYKYFSATYHWTGLSLDFRAQYAVMGIGLRF